MKKLFLSLFICFFCSTFIFAQSDEPEYVDFQKRAIGINVPFYPEITEEFFTGDIDIDFIFMALVRTSLCYQKYFDNGMGYQIELGLANFSLEYRNLIFLEPFEKTSNISCFYYVNLVSDLLYMMLGGLNLGIGAGIGIEPVFWGHLSIPLKIGACLHCPYGEPELGLYANLGLAYRF